MRVEVFGKKWWQQQEIGYGRKRAPGGRWPAAVEMLMIVGTIRDTPERLALDLKDETGGMHWCVPLLEPH